MAFSTASAPDDDRVLWDVVQEHLAEAEFCLEQLDRAFFSPIVTLGTVAKGIEARLLAHVDSLVVGGETVRKRLLDPAMSVPDPAEPGMIVATALALAASGNPDSLRPALAHEDARVRSAAARGCARAAGERIPSWLVERLSAKPSARECASLFEVCGALGVRVSPLIEWLQCGEPWLVFAAVKAALHSDPTIHLPVIEYLLDHPDESVCETALLAALAWGSSRAWARCGQWALDTTRPWRFPMALYSALGGPDEHERLTALLGRPSHARAVLVALAFSGNVGLLPALAERVENDDPRIRRLAAQAIASITGVSPSTVALSEGSLVKAPAGARPSPEEDPAAQEALPPLEEDDLDADLAPPFEDALPEPDPVALRRTCDEARSRMTPDRRWMDGKPFSPAGLVSHLHEAPLGQRRVLAASLWVRTRATAWIDTRALSQTQERQLARASEIARTTRGSSRGW